MYFCQITTIHSIILSVVETASVLLLRNTHNLNVMDFTTEKLAVHSSLSQIGLRKSNLNYCEIPQLSPCYMHKSNTLALVPILLLVLGS